MEQFEILCVLRYHRAPTCLANKKNIISEKVQYARSVRVNDCNAGRGNHRPEAADNTL